MTTRTNTPPNTADTLTWTNLSWRRIAALGVTLATNYPTVEPLTVTPSRLTDFVNSLPNFDASKGTPDDFTLSGIVEAWTQARENAAVPTRTPDKEPLQLYRVTWEIDIHAKTPHSAANIARAIPSDAGPTPMHLEVSQRSSTVAGEWVSHGGFVVSHPDKLREPTATLPTPLDQPGILNPMRKALLAAYPDIDLLPIDITNPAEVHEAVTAGNNPGGTGDTLFNFLWLELDQDVADDKTEAMKRLRRALTDVFGVFTHIATN